MRRSHLWTDLPVPIPEMCETCLFMEVDVCMNGIEDHQKCRSHRPKDGRDKIFNVILDEEQGGISA